MVKRKNSRDTRSPVVLQGADDGRFNQTTYSEAPWVLDRHEAKPMFQSPSPNGKRRFNKTMATFGNSFGSPDNILKLSNSIDAAKIAPDIVSESQTYSVIPRKQIQFQTPKTSLKQHILVQDKTTPVSPFIKKKIIRAEESKSTLEKPSSRHMKTQSSRKTMNKRQGSNSSLSKKNQKHSSNHATNMIGNQRVYDESFAKMLNLNKAEYASMCQDMSRNQTNFKGRTSGAIERDRILNYILPQGGQMDAQQMIHTSPAATKQFSLRQPTSVDSPKANLSFSVFSYSGVIMDQPTPPQAYGTVKQRKRNKAPLINDSLHLQGSQSFF